MILCQVEKRTHGTIPMAFMRFAIKKGGTTQWKKVIAFKVYFKEYIATLQLNVVLFNTMKVT